MPIQISGHNFETTPTLKDFIEKKFSRVKKHFDHITSFHVFLSVDKLSQKAEVTIHIPGHEIYASAESEDMYKTIDFLVDKVVRQLEKYKGKFDKNHG